MEIYFLVAACLPIKLFSCSIIFTIVSCAIATCLILRILIRFPLSHFIPLNFVIFIQGLPIEKINFSHKIQIQSIYFPCVV